MPMLALVHPVFDCLMRLAQPDALLNEEEVRIDPPYNYIYTILALIPSLSCCRWTVWCCSCIGSESSSRMQTGRGWTSFSSSCETGSCCRKASAPCPACCCWNSWSFELEDGHSAPPQTSTTTVKLLSRIVLRASLLHIF